MSSGQWLMLVVNYVQNRKLSRSCCTMVSRPAIFDSSSTPSTTATPLMTAAAAAEAASSPPPQVSPWYKRVYEDKRCQIDPQCYAELMSPVTASEVLEVASSCPY